MAEKHSCFLSVDTVHYSVIFSLLQCNFLDSAVVAELSAFLAIFSFSLIQKSQFAFVDTFFKPLRFIVLSQASLTFSVVSAAFEDEAVPCCKIVALYSYFEPES